MANESILAMEFIGDENGTPAPQLRNTTVEEPEKFLDMIIKQIKALYNGGLVHADLSEYNILVYQEKPYLIDMGQAVVKAS